MPYLDYRLGRDSRKIPDYASISGHFTRCFAYFARVSGVIVICSEITDCGKSEQNPSSCYCLLVVKLVVKGKRLLLMIFVRIFFLYYNSFSIDFNSNRKSVNKIVFSAFFLLGYGLSLFETFTVSTI